MPAISRFSEVCHFSSQWPLGCRHVLLGRDYLFWNYCCNICSEGLGVVILVPYCDLAPLVVMFVGSFCCFVATGLFSLRLFVVVFEIGCLLLHHG